MLSTNGVQRSLPIRAEQIHLEQVILNLATNGMDAMANSAAGKRKISIQTALTGGPDVEVSVTDSGTGIPPEKLKDVFDTFYTTKQEGTGLGLSIARTIVETYGGKIWAENRSGGGAVFRFTLPLSGSASGMTEPAAVVHVVDDDAPFRTAVSRLLRASGYEVALYESGEQLLKNAPGDAPGCILLDVRMSGLDGLELQDRLRQMGSILPIVFLTGHGDLPTSVKAIKAGAEDFLAKPVSKDTLLEAVERALALYRERHDQRSRLDHLRALISKLTPRESEVFALIVRGRLNKQIAYELGTSERTIKAHRHAVMEKLEVASLAEAVSIAERLGMLPARD